MNPLPRRTVLRGLGAVVGLPWLEAMTPRRLQASSLAAGPTRLAYVYVPNGVHLPDWTPKTVGPNLDLPPILEPLTAVREDLLVLSGLALDPARAHGDGGGDHARAMATFLTGIHPRKTGGADLRAGISVDQVAAREVGRATRFASLEIGCEGGRDSGQCDHGYSCAYQVNLSWRGESTPSAKEVDPRLVFERLFADRLAGESRSSTSRRERRDRSLPTSSSSSGCSPTDSRASPVRRPRVANGETGACSTSSPRTPASSATGSAWRIAESSTST